MPLRETRNMSRVRMQSLLQRRFVWNGGQWPLLMALASFYLFWAGGLIAAGPLAIAALVFGLRTRFTFYSVSAVVLSIFVLLGCVFFLTPLCNLLNP